MVSSIQTPDPQDDLRVLSHVLNVTPPELWDGFDVESPEERVARLDAASDILDELISEFRAVPTELGRAA